MFASAPFEDVPLFDTYYHGASPQLLLRIYDRWAARRLDLHACWKAAVIAQRGFHPQAPNWPRDCVWHMDQLCLYDQCVIWIAALRHATDRMLAVFDETGEGALSHAQLLAVSTICARLSDEIAAVRMLAIIGLATPAMQITRSISEDVDLALLLLVRPKLARRFVECRTPEEASGFWRKHVGGGRAFRAITERLYQTGLDLTEQDDYTAWRHGAMATLGAAVHTSFLSGRAAMNGAEQQSLDAVHNCIYFTIVRIQEFCAYASVLGKNLQEDIARLVNDETRCGRPATPLLNMAHLGQTIMIDQIDWLVEMQGGDAPSRAQAADRR